MKKILAMLLLAALLLTSAMPALAVSAEYASTRAFLKVLDEADIIYTLVGVDDDGDELVRVANKDSNDYSYTINLYFDKDEMRCALRVWNVIEFKSSDTTNVLRACNELNARFKYLRFYVDTSDNTVTAAMDLIFRDGAGEVTLEGLVRTAQILVDGRPTLLPYNK